MSKEFQKRGIMWVRAERNKWAWGWFDVTEVDSIGVIVFQWLLSHNLGGLK